MQVPVTEPLDPPLRSRRRQIAVAIAILLGLWAVSAYVLLPMVWDFYFRRRPSLDDTPGLTQTSVGIPGDPINVALIGTSDEVARIMRAAHWTVADPLGLKSDLRIAADTVLDRPYENAPVSSLFLYGRKEDLAFEKPVGDNPQHRNHVRFWKAPTPGAGGRPLWVGSATYDKGIGLSHTTGQVTHHIAEDVDAERARLFDDLKQTQALAETYVEKGFHKVLAGKNGGGDPWQTDGDLWVGVIAPE